MKNYSTAVKEAIAAGNPITTLVTMDLTQSDVNLTMADKIITWDGVDYLPQGLLVSISSLDESTSLDVQSINMQFSMADPTILALFSNENQQNRKVLISLVVLDDRHQVIGSLFSKTYIIDNYSDDDDGSGDALLSVNISNWVSDYQATRGIRTTQASFQRFYPDSTAFVNSKDIDEDLDWGG